MAPACDRSGPAVDTGKELVGIEVKASMMRTPKLSRSSRSFKEAYRPKRVIVLNQSLNHSETIEKTSVSWLPFE